jgi:hypothetical protein
VLQRTGAASSRLRAVRYDGQTFWPKPLVVRGLGMLGYMACPAEAQSAKAEDPRSKSAIRGSVERTEAGYDAHPAVDDYRESFCSA